MLTILEKSVKGPKLRNFHEHKWRSSNNLANTLTETFWIIKTPVRKFLFIEYLKIKALMGLCNEAEVKCLYDAPGVLRDDLFVNALRAWQSEVSKEILFGRLQDLQRFEQRNIWSPNLFHTYDGVIRYEIEELRRSIRKVKKYSGYVRNSSSVGSKNSSRRGKPEPEIFEWNSNMEIDYYHYLTVGEFSSDQPGDIFFTLMSTKSTKRKIL
jgi:hypothetical protein